MSNCFNTPIIFIAIFFVVMAVIFIQCTKEPDNFYVRGRSPPRTASPYYTSAFQAYPGKYMAFGSNRNHYCLQQHQEYAGYRNCMLYLE